MVPNKTKNGKYNQIPVHLTLAGKYFAVPSKVLLFLFVAFLIKQPRIITVCGNCARRNLFEILLNQTEIRLYLEPNGRPFGSKSMGKC